MKTTGVVLTITAIVLAIYDGYAVWAWGIDASISRFLQDTAIDSPVASFGIGFLCGHCFGYMKPNQRRVR